MSALFNLLISRPFYNGFILLMKYLPFFDAGVIVIVFTIVVKLLLLPLSLKASRAQIEMKGHERALADLKEKYKDNKEEHGKKTMEYYKEHGINPFASLFILIIQLPIIIGLYRVFLKSGLPVINTALLYSFVSAPTNVNMVFLNFVNIAEKSLFLAFLAGVTTYFQISIASNTQMDQGGSQNDMAKAMAMQMKYFFPILMAFISYTISSAVALYFITSNLFAIGQELYVRAKYKKNVFVE